MRIIINGKHKDKLKEALEKEQTHCKARVLSCLDVENILNGITDRLSISKKSMDGIKLKYTGAEKFPRAYKYTPESTHFEAEHNGRYWIVTSVNRSTCPNRHGNVNLILSDCAKTALINAFNSFDV